MFQENFIYKNRKRAAFSLWAITLPIPCRGTILFISCSNFVFEAKLFMGFDSDWSNDMLILFM